MNIRINFLRVGSSRLNETIEYIAELTRREPHLLEQTCENLLEVAQTGRLLIALDQDADNRFVGCIMLWELRHPIFGQLEWYELGTIYVEPEYRYSQTGFSVADMLYRKLLDSFPDLWILGTTTNPSAIKAGHRVGLCSLKFAVLGRRVQEATCVCSASKRGTSEPGECLLRDKQCHVRISAQTFERIQTQWWTRSWPHA
jgi:hypothetical protein